MGVREVLFRGKRKDNGEWVYGYYVSAAARECILQSLGCLWNDVIPDTVGQYTGLTDKNGKKIFEDDIVCGTDAIKRGFEVYGYIDHKNGSFVIVGDVMTHYRWLDYNVEIIGNIHDNPELI